MRLWLHRVTVSDSLKDAMSVCGGPGRKREKKCCRIRKGRDGIYSRRFRYETGNCDYGSSQRGRIAVAGRQIRQKRDGRTEEDIEDLSSLGPSRSTKTVTSNEFGKLDWRANWGEKKRRPSVRVDEWMKGQRS